MSQWGKTDDAANSVIWAPAKFNQAPTRVNANLMYGNTTADAFVTNESVAMVHVNDAEMNRVHYKVTAATPNNAGAAYVAGDVLTVANTGAGDSNTIVEATLNVQDTEVSTITLNGVGTGGSYVPATQLILANGTYSVNASANITTTEVRTVAITTAGTGYANGDTVRPAGGTQTTNAVFTVTTGAADTIPASLALTNRGVFTDNPTNLTTGNTVAITGTGTGLKVTITTRIKTLGAITTGARGTFTVNPTATGATTTPASGDGTGATVDNTIRIKTLTVNTAGVYTVQTNVTAAALAGGTGTGATAVLTEPEVLSEAKSGSGMTGWAVRRIGTGGRAGRVQYEVLVAGAGGDQANGTSDDPFLP